MSVRIARSTRPRTSLVSFATNGSLATRPAARFGVYYSGTGCFFVRRDAREGRIGSPMSRFSSQGLIATNCGPLSEVIRGFTSGYLSCARCPSLSSKEGRSTARVGFAVGWKPGAANYKSIAGVRAGSFQGAYSFSRDVVTVRTEDFRQRANVEQIAITSRSLS